VPDDPTLLLTAAGMVRFKPYFQGIRKPPYPRAASVQKCIRTTDINNVGKTLRHLTFFEMLGNFSFGDYYKREAIQWAWEFITQRLKLDESRLWATVYFDDEEAVTAWKAAGVPAKRIVKLGEEDNFWSAGPTGPCGPCSEIIYDQGEDFKCDKSDCRVGCDCDRYLELWNLVFMQYDRNEAGELLPLKMKGIDTGMGLERLASVLQSVKSNFETDLLFPILKKVSEIAGLSLKKISDEGTVSLRIITDHIKAVTFLIGDGVIPSNEGRGYVLRRLIRRAIRHAKILNIEQSFVPQAISSVIETMGQAYPVIAENSVYIKNIAEQEEIRFSKTLKSGMLVLEQVINDVKAKDLTRISGKDAFKLYETYGFPLELTVEMAQEHGLTVDEDEFTAQMEEHQKISAGIFEAKEKDKVLTELEFKLKPAEFVGYADYKSNAKVLAVLKDGEAVKSAQKGDKVSVVLNKTSFYATSGGQIGDSGKIASKSGEVEIETTDKTPGGLFIHIGKVKSGEIKVDDDVETVIDIKKRLETERGHTATHILHWALRYKFGEHVKQAGSLVEPGRFRFDYTLGRALSDEEIEEIEKLVNIKIIENHPVRSFTTSVEYAKQTGAVALFGEKYGEFVRVVETGNFSKELCGGTHASATGNIGLFKITGESSVGANLRRIEALVGQKALGFLLERNKMLVDISRKLGTGVEGITQKIDLQASRISGLEAQINKVEKKRQAEEVELLINSVEKIDDVNILLKHLPDTDPDTLRKYCDSVKEKLKSVAIVLVSSTNDRVNIVSAMTGDLIKRGYSAGKVVKELAPIVKGGGGGRADLAQAGGKDASAIPKLITMAKQLLSKGQ
jgi:alanyl-tRNA synthetase